MAMEISKSFVLKAAPDAAWQFFIDPARVARCLPGAAITNQIDENTYAGTITVKVGPVAATYKGTMKFDELDAATKTAAIVASGQDVRGKGGADLRMTSRLIERSPSETEVQISSQVNVMGILAQFGRGMIQDVSDQMFDKFVAAARAELEATAPPPPATAGGGSSSTAMSSGSERTAGGTPPIEVLSFASAVIGRALRRAAQKPEVWIGAGIALAAVWWFRRRR
jgi:carbon monoxide dehydrogenase subunit G